MDEKLRVVVVEQRGTGGMIHYAYQICTAMAKEGAQVTLVTAQEYELENFPHNFEVAKLFNLWSRKSDSLLIRPPRNRVEALQIKIFWEIRRGFRAIKLISSWFRVTRFLVQTHPDIVQFGETQFQFEAFFYNYLKRRGIALSQICHEFEAREVVKNLWVRLSDRLLGVVFGNFSVLFFHGEANKKKFLSLFDFPKNRLYTIQHGNEQIFPDSAGDKTIADTLKEKYGIQANHHVVTFFGNVTPSKGVPDLIKAFDIISKSDKNARLIIAGMPSKQMDMSSVYKLVAELKIDLSVVFDARYLDMEEIGPLMKISDVVVFPYRNITQSGAIQVAYAFGKPVVATNTGGFPEVVDEGESGFLVPPEAPKQLAEAILKIISNPDLAESMGKHAKHLSETRFAWEPIAGEILTIYRKTLHDPEK